MKYAHKLDDDVNYYVDPLIQRKKKKKNICINLTKILPHIFLCLSFQYSVHYIIKC